MTINFLSLVNVPVDVGTSTINFGLDLLDTTFGTYFYLFLGTFLVVALLLLVIKLFVHK